MNIQCHDSPNPRLRHRTMQKTSKHESTIDAVEMKFMKKISWENERIGSEKWSDQRWAKTGTNIVSDKQIGWYGDISRIHENGLLERSYNGKK